jgi:fructose-1,6-bisphosphatase/inositol monophosphatase family enzyme
VSSESSEAILDILKDVADRIINPRFGTLDPSQIDEKSHAHDLVTVADREAELAISATLTRIYPDACVLGEEAFAADPASLGRFYDADHAFTIDPIDGTLNFVNGSPDHAVMLAEIVEGDVVRSWIWQPQHELAFVAERGAGVTRNDVPVPRRSVGSGTDLHRIRTSHARWHGSRLDGLGVFEPTWMCCGVDYPNLLMGPADVLVYRGTQMPWDHSPGLLMATEVGGEVGLWDGTPYRPGDPRPPTHPVILVAAADTDLLTAAIAPLESWPAA